MGMFEEVAEGVSLLFILPDSTAFVVLFFVIRLLVGLQLLVGYRTRVAVVLSFLLTVSLDMRNPFVLSYSDNMFRILLFWGMFLPLGERRSIDGVVHDDDRRLPELLVRATGFFALTQIVAIYFINGVQKLQMSGWLTGEKVVDLANSSEMTYLLGVYLHHLPEQVLQATGAAWVYLLLASPLLLLLSGKYRTAFALFFVAGHLFILFTFGVGAFSLVAISALILFVGSDTWENIESNLVATLRPEGFVRVVKRVIPERGRYLSEASHNVLVVLAAVLLLVSGVSMVSANIDTVAESRGAGDIYDEPSLLGAVQDTKEMFGVHQPEWTIMTDAPQVDRYFVFAGQTSGGATKDLYNDRVLSFERPYEDLTHQYETYRERFYMYNMIRVVEGPDTPGMLGMGISEYLCGIRREDDGERLEEVSIYLIFQERDSKKRMGASLYHHTCGGKHPPEPVGYPPTENISVDGLEPIVVDKPLTASFASGIENMSRDLSFDGKTDDLNLQMCKRKPKPFVFEKLQEHTRRHEVRNPVSGIENVTGVKTEILRKQRNTNALALRHGMTVHTQQRAVDNPIIYVANYIITDSFIYRRVLSTEKTQIPTLLLRKNQGFVRCFS